MQKGFAPTILIIGFLVMIIVVLVDQKYGSSPSYAPTSTPAPTATPDPTADWKTYQDSFVGYSFKYPADFVPYYQNSNNNVFHSQNATFDPKTTAKLTGVDLGSLGELRSYDKQDYIGVNTGLDSELASKLNLPTGVSAKVYDNLEDITVAIDYKKNQDNMRILIWCGGEKGNLDSCKSLLDKVLPTFKLTL